MRRRTSPGFAEWLFVTFAIAGSLFLFYQLYQYGAARQLFPVGLQVAGVDVSGLTRAEAERRLLERYMNAPIIVYHRDQPVEILPSRAEFKLNTEAMMTRAVYERDQQDYWAGFWGYLWGRPVDVSPVPLDATHSDEALRETLRVIRDQFDTPALPPQPVSATMSFQPGSPGVRTDIEASLPNVAAALYRNQAREAYLTLEVAPSDRPTIDLLSTLITNSIQEFQARSGGVAGLHIIDLATGQETGYNAQLPLTGVGVLKLPIMLEALRLLGAAPSAEPDALLRTAALETDTQSANELLKIVAGQDNMDLGVDVVNDGLRRLGLVNTFLGCPFDAPERSCETRRTPANSLPNSAVAPSPYYQTTAEDLAVFLSYIYYCAEYDAGALRVVHPDLTAAACRRAVAYLAANRIGSLIEEGVPSDVTVAHRHGWQSDIYLDAGIVYSPGGPYVIVVYAHKPGWLAWEIGSPLLADLSRAAFNYFNFDSPYLVQR